MKGLITKSLIMCTMKTLLSFLSVLILCNIASSQIYWTNQPTGVTVFLNDIFFVNQNTGYCVGNNGTFLYTINGGTNWGNRNIVSGAESLTKVWFINDSTGFVIYSDKVMKTNNRGVNWTTQTLGCPLKDISFRSTASGLVGYVTGSNNTISGLIYRTINHGLTWTICGDFQYKDFYAVELPSDSVVIACGAGSFMARSSNNGVNWSQYYLGTVPLIDIDFPNALTGYVCGGTIAKSTNGGINWFGFTSPGSGMEMWSLSFPNTNTGYCSGFGPDPVYRIQKTTDAGSSWVHIGIQYDTINVPAIFFINPSTGWICGNSGTIRKTTTGGVSPVTNISVIVPSEYSLEQNYPNPFNPSTKIKFAIPESGFTTLKIFDALGREVQTLINEKLSPGIYETAFNAAILPSGVYFYRLQAGSFTDTKRMTLIK